MQHALWNSHPSVRRTVGIALDASLALLAPAVLVIDALLLARSDDAAAAELEVMVKLLVLLPWAALLPVAVRTWLRHVGLPTPGRYLCGERRRPRGGALWVDIVIVTAAVFASLPLFYASEILLTEAVAAVALLVVPTAMVVGSLVTASRDR